MINVVHDHLIALKTRKTILALNLIMHYCINHGIFLFAYNSHAQEPVPMRWNFHFYDISCPNWEN